VGGFELHLDARFISDDGWLRGKLDIPQQNVKQLSVHSVRQEGDVIHFELMTAAGNEVFEGTFKDDHIQGTWAQRGTARAFHLERGEVRKAVADLPYIEEEVTYPNGDITLAGTLTRPKNVDLPPAVILISGSGPQNRDDFMVGLEPFKVMADYFVRRGIAVLRVDDRGIGKSTGNFASATTLDFATDVEAGFAWLKRRPDIDPNHIGLLGHSEGGLIAPIVASRNQDVAFIVLMAGPGRPGAEIVREQSALVARAAGLSEADVRANDALLTRAFKLLEKGEGLSSLREEFIAVGRVGLNTLPAEDKAQIGSPEVLAAQQMRALESPWFRFFIGYDPAPALKQVKCPVLAVNGGLDLQVPAKSNLKAIEDALKAGKNRDVQIVELPGLNHLFQRAKTGSPAEYTSLPKEMEPRFLEVTSSWITAHTGVNARK
jgi:hypothetical protein